MANDRHRMAQVNVLQAIEALQRIDRELNEKLELQAIQHMRYAVHKVTDAMEAVFRKNLK